MTDPLFRHRPVTNAAQMRHESCLRCRHMYKTIAVCVLAACWLAACSCSKKTEEGAAGTPSVKSSGPVSLNASGSTFQKQFQEAAIESFTKTNKTVTVNYGAGGSGK